MEVLQLVMTEVVGSCVSRVFCVCVCYLNKTACLRLAWLRFLSETNVGSTKFPKKKKSPSLHVDSTKIQLRLDR